jgi:hypothetical protein
LERPSLLPSPTPRLSSAPKHVDFAFNKHYGGLPSWWPTSLPAPELCRPTLPLPPSVVAQLRGVIAHIEGRKYIFTCEPLPATRGDPHCPQHSPPPKPWHGRLALWYPHPLRAKPLAQVLTEHHGSGLFVGCRGGAWEHVLNNDPGTVRWKVYIKLPTATLSAVFFDATTNRNTRRRAFRKGCCTSWTLRTIANFNPLDPLPLLLPKLKPTIAQQIATRLSLTGLTPSLNLLVASFACGPEPMRYDQKYCKPALDTFSSDQPLPSQVQSSGASGPYCHAALVKALQETPYTMDSQLQLVGLQGLLAGAGGVSLQPQQGFRMEPDNLKPLDGHQDYVRSKLLEGTQLDHPTFAGPYKRVPYPNVSCPHQGLVSPTSITQKGSKWAFLADSIFDEEITPEPDDWSKLTGGGKLRVLIHASYPEKEADSLNALQIGPRIHMLYLSASDVKMLMAALPGCAILTFDVKAAYNTLNLRPQDLWAYVLRIVTSQHGLEYFVQLVHPFGSQDAEACWQIFAHLLLWLLRTLDGFDLLRICLFYVDNFVFAIPAQMLGNDPTSVILEAKSQLLAFLKKFGVPFHEDEICFGKQAMELLGFLWHASPNSIQLKPGRRALCIQLLSFLGDATRPLTLKILEGALGMFSYYGTFLHLLNPYIADLRHSTKSVTYSRRKVKRSRALVEGAIVLRAVIVDMSDDTSFPITKCHHPGTPPDQLWQSDASTSKGTGGINVTSGHFFMHRWSERQLQEGMREERLSSTHMETLGPIICACLWMHQDELDELEVDSKDLSDAWKLGYSTSPATNYLQRCLRVFALRKRSVLRIRHIHREHNYPSDALSELDLEVQHNNQLTLELPRSPL